MLTCEQALELISAQLDGALTAEEAGALDEHLAQCPACRALRADLSTLHQLLPTLAEAPRRAEGQHYESGPRLQMHPLPHQKAPVALALLGLSGRGAGACTGGRAGCAPLEPSGQLRERTQSQSCRVDRSGLRRERRTNRPGSGGPRGPRRGARRGRQRQRRRRQPEGQLRR